MILVHLVIIHHAKEKLSHAHNWSTSTYIGLKMEQNVNEIHRFTVSLAGHRQKRSGWAHEGETMNGNLKYLYNSKNATAKNLKDVYLLCSSIKGDHVLIYQTLDGKFHCHA